MQICSIITVTDFACYNYRQVACISLQQQMAGAHKLETNTVENIIFWQWKKQQHTIHFIFSTFPYYKHHVHHDLLRP